MKAVQFIAAIFFMLLLYAVVTLPGTFLLYFLWKPTFRIGSRFSKHLLQSAMIAVAYAPVIYGHAGPIPAVFALLGNDPMFRGQAIVSLVLLFVIAFAILTVLALRRSRRSPADY